MIILTIPGRLPGLNDIIDAARGNKYEAARQKKEYTEMIAWLAKKYRLPKMEKISLKISWYEKSKQRDPDNIHAGIKFILDGLVMAGVIENDTQKHIHKVEHDPIQVDRNNPRVEIEIVEVA